MTDMKPGTRTHHERLSNPRNVQKMSATMPTPLTAGNTSQRLERKNGRLDMGPPFPAPLLRQMADYNWSAIARKIEFRVRRIRSQRIPCRPRLPRSRLSWQALSRPGSEVLCHNSLLQLNLLYQKQCCLPACQ